MPFTLNNIKRQIKDELNREIKEKLTPGLPMDITCGKRNPKKYKDLNRSEEVPLAQLPCDNSKYVGRFRQQIRSRY